MLPVYSATVLDALAVREGTPRKTSAGTDTNEPPPPTAFIAPATIPAINITTSRNITICFSSAGAEVFSRPSFVVRMSEDGFNNVCQLPSIQLIESVCDEDQLLFS